MSAAPAWAQATSIVEPPNPGLLSFAREWAANSSLGDLRRIALPDSAIELRLWGGFGLGGTSALILTRSPRGVWTGKHAVVGTCQIVVPQVEEISKEQADSLRKIGRRRCPPKPDHGGQVFNLDTLAITGVKMRPDQERIWRELVSLGLYELPTHIVRNSIMVDGFSYVLEIRRGKAYRASELATSDEKAEGGEGLMRRIADALRRAYPQQAP